MRKTVVIDYSPERASQYRLGWAIVAVDVIRATTTAITAAAAGWKCFPTPTIAAALELAKQFDNPLLAGESRGNIPPGFEIDNSPVAIAARSDTHRPLVLVSSSGTKVIHEAAGCKAVYISCFRNYSVLAHYLAEHHDRVAVIGAGSLGEFREEDQACCAWVAAGLQSHGYAAYDQATTTIIDRWCRERPQSCLCSRSVEFLERTGRVRDLEFIFSHIDDLPAVFTVEDGQVRMVFQDGLPTSGQNLESATAVSFPSRRIVES
jgi:2-phosphosulfolactate phosphatase